MSKEGDGLKEFHPNKPSIILSQDDNEELWRQASISAWVSLHERFPCADINFMNDVLPGYQKKNFARLAANRLILKDSRDLFSMGDLQRLFGLNIWSQRSLVENGDSSARLKGKRIYYSREGAEETIYLFLCKKFFTNSWGSLCEELGFTEKNFPYWSLHRDIGISVPLSNQPSKN